MIIEAIPGSSIKFPSPHNSLLGGQSTIKKYFDSRSDPNDKPKGEADGRAGQDSGTGHAGDAGTRE